MTAGSESKSRLSRFHADRRGNFGMISALVLPVGIFVVGVALDTISALEMRQNMQSSADAASLAAVSAMISDKKTYTLATAQTEAKTFMASQLIQSLSSLDSSKLKTELAQNTSVSVTNPSNGVYSATIRSTLSMPLNPFTRLLAGESIKLSVNSTSSAEKENNTGLSMYMVLDKSGSMSFKTETKKLTADGKTTQCVNYTENNWNYNGITNKKDKNYIAPSTCYIRKIEALQSAGNTLLKAFSEVESSATRVRTGAVAYSDKTTDATGMNWGTAKAKDYIDALPYKTEGGTDATAAMDLAFEALRNSDEKESNEKKEHDKKGNTKFNRYILLMTDGMMTGASAEWKEHLDNETRDICTKAKGNGIVIFTVAFMAPQKGKDLLNACATDASHYYEAADMTSLVKAFKEIATKATNASVRLTN